MSSMRVNLDERRAMAAAPTPFVQGAAGASMPSTYLHLISPGHMSSSGGVSAYWRFDKPDHDALVACVRTLVVEKIDRKFGAAELAEAVGASESSLRRAILAETGLQLASFVMSVKLDRVHDWLSSDREVRSLARITAAVGLKSSNALSRAYRRRFGESMSETRCRAVNASD